MASGLKMQIAEGKTVGGVCQEVGLPYQVIYRLARGDTWPEATPTGNVLNAINRGLPGRRRKIGTKQQYQVWKALRAGVQVSRLVAATKMSPTSLRRHASEFELLLSVRVSRLQLTSGSYKLAMKRYGLSLREAEQMDHDAASIELAPNMEKVVEEGLPALEKNLKNGDD
jgi:hypothetical protein